MKDNLKKKLDKVKKNKYFFIKCFCSDKRNEHG